MTDHLDHYRRWDAISAAGIRDELVIDLRSDGAGTDVPAASPNALLHARLHGLPGRKVVSEDELAVIDVRDEVLEGSADGLPDLTPIQPEGIEGDWRQWVRVTQATLAVRAAAKLDAGSVPLGQHVDARS